MKRTLLVLVVAACGTDDPIDPGPDAAPAEFCASSTEPETVPAWQACRAANVDSWPLVCDAGQVAPPCAFEVTTTDGEMVLCRPAGECR